MLHLLWKRKNVEINCSIPYQFPILFAAPPKCVWPKMWTSGRSLQKWCRPAEWHQYQNITKRNKQTIVIWFLFVNCDYRFFLNIEVFFVDYLKAYKSLRQKAENIYQNPSSLARWNFMEWISQIITVIELAIITSETWGWLLHDFSVDPSFAQPRVHPLLQVEWAHRLDGWF